MCYCYCFTMLHSNNCPEVWWYSFGVMPFLGDKGRRLEGEFAINGSCMCIT